MKFLLVLLFAVILLPLSPTEAFADHEITRWRYGHTAAVSVTFDDALYSQVAVGVPLLEERGLLGTFYVLTGDGWNEWQGYWDDWRAVAAGGHEIGSHTVTHAQLSVLSELEMRVELEESKQTIDAEIPGQVCRTLAYPYGDYDDLVEEVASDYYIAARTVWSPLYLNFYPGDPYAEMDPYAIGSLPFDWPGLITLEALVDYLDSAEEHEAWFMPHIHPLDDPTAVDVYTGFLDELLVRDLWVDTVFSVVRYMEERNAAVLTVQSESPTEITLTLTHALDPAIYDLPLTLRSAVPAAWTAVGVQQGAMYDVIESVQEGGETVVFYEVAPNGGTITLVPDVIGNMAPLVDAGSDLTLYLPEADGLLIGSVDDDGLPAPPGAVSIAWSLVSGPAGVVFGDPAAASTTASFTLAGTYVLELSASDGEKGATDQCNVTVIDGAVPVSIEVQVAVGSDDAEESASGGMYLDSSDLELVYDSYNGPGNQTVGLRFQSVLIPIGANIVSAWLQFTTDETGTGAANLVVRGQDADDAGPFTTSPGNVSGRPATAAQVAWVPPAWNSVGQSGLLQQTPDLSSVLQEIVDRPGWDEGHALALIVTGTGTRTAVSCDASPGAAPVLHVEYSMGPPVNKAPQVDAGPDETLFLPVDTLILDGAVVDDGLPTPDAVSTLWSVASGPAGVVFGDVAALDTQVSFPGAGTWALELYATDGELDATDQMVVTIQEAGQYPGTFETRILSGSDDVEESQTGGVYLDSSDLELVFDYYNGPGEQVVGLRFTGVEVPQGAAISAAWVQFQVDEVGADPTSIMFYGHDADDAASFNTSAGDVSSRPKTLADVTWNPAAWNSVGLAGAAQRTPELAAVIQEIVSRAGWSAGNALVLVASGTGKRVAVAYDGTPSAAPLLHIDFVTGAPVNQVPVVDAGPDDSTVLPEDSVLLAGSASDDGLPSPPGALSLLWSLVSGPAAVDFGDTGAAVTTATFSVAGTYVLSLTADDGIASASDEITVLVSPGGGGGGIVEVQIASGADDAEESPTGGMYLESSDLELVFDYYNGAGDQTVGMRFTGVGVPAGAQITAAWLRFQVDEVTSDAAALVLRAQDSDDAPAFSLTSGDISGRAVTGSQVSWSPDPWTVVGQSGAAQLSPDLSALVQDVVDRPGWSTGNALVIVVTGSGRRVAESYEGSAAGAPLLHIEYSSPQRKPSRMERPTSRGSRRSP